MIDSLFNKKLSKKFDSVAHREAKLQKQKEKLNKEEAELCKEFMRTTDSETMYTVFSIIEKFGHPNEQNISKNLREKYKNQEDLTFEDLQTLDALYKSNCKNIRNKGEDDE